MVDPRTPILVGCGQLTDRADRPQISKPETARSPFDLAAEAGRLALADAGAAQLKGSIDTLAMLETKTRGNLDPEEAKLLDGLLYELRMHYVEVSK